MSTARSQMSSSFRRTMQRFGWDDGSNNTNSYRTQLYNAVVRVVGPGRVKILAFIVLISTFFLYVLVIQNHEISLQEHYHISVFHKNIHVISSDSSQSANSTTPASVPITTTNSTENSTETSEPDNLVDNNSNQQSMTSFWASIFFSVLMWMMVMQMIRCMRQMAIMSGRDPSQLRAIQLTQLGNRNAPGFSTRLRLAMLQRDFTGDDYEMLQQLDNNDARQNLHGADEASINRLPIHNVTAEEQTATPDTESGQSHSHNNCNICLGPYEVGEEVRTLICLHKFHRGCIDPWLRTNAVCPICKYPAVEQSF